MKRFLTLLAFNGYLLTACAQDVHLSQFYESALLRNPALTGVFSSDYKVSLNYRHQWSSFATPFKTGMITAETKAMLPATGDFIGFGLTAIYDKAGAIDFTSTSAYASVSYSKALGLDHRNFLTAGLCGGYLQRSINPSRMRFANQFAGGAYNATNATGENINSVSVYHFDVSGGISISGTTASRSHYYLGIAGYHISKPKETYWDEAFIRLTTRWSANAGYSKPLSDRSGIAFHANYTHQAPYREVIGGGLFSYRFASLKGDGQKAVIFSAGCFYRLNDAVIPTIKLDYKPWAITMSYDISMGSNRPHMNGLGSWELTAAIRGNYHHKTPRTDCPDIEPLNDQTSF